MQATTLTRLQVPEAALRVRYYHQDHLGSSAHLTDANAASLEETAFYPFGGTRLTHTLQTAKEGYKFTQKEHDAETGLEYFGCRFLSVSLPRFVSVDPLAQDLRTERLQEPQRLSAYSYCANRALVLTDPTGLDAKEIDELVTSVPVTITPAQAQQAKERDDAAARAVQEVLGNTAVPAPTLRNVHWNRNQPIVAHLQKELRDVFPEFRHKPPTTQPYVGAGYVNRTTAMGTFSAHSEGRAVDIYLSANNPSERRLAEALFRLFSGPNAAALGIQHVIFNRQIWSAADGPDSYTGGDRNPHTDHVHVAFTRAGSQEQPAQLHSLLVDTAVGLMTGVP